MTEKELLQEIANGNRIAFSIFYNSHIAKVYNIALSYTKSVPEAEDITQEVFAKIFLKANSFKGNSSISTWIYRITINTSLDHIKKIKRTRSHTESLNQTMIDFEHPGALHENKEKAKLLFKAIDLLQTNQKTAFILSYIEGLPRQKVADIMKVSLKSIEGLLQRAKQNLRTELKKWYPEQGKSK